MKLINRNYISLDKFINKALYQEDFGLYMKKNPIGKYGDFITAPNISILFSEMIAIWIISFWQKLNFPKKINIIELGAGNGEMIYQMASSFKNFNKFDKSYNLFIFEKSPLLKKIQKNKLKDLNIRWIDSLDYKFEGPKIFLANDMEFFSEIL